MRKATKKEQEELEGTSLIIVPLGKKKDKIKTGKAAVKKLTAEQIFKKEYSDSKHYITPELVRYGKITDNLVYEVSKGKKPIVGGDLFGLQLVSIDKQGNTKREDELSKCFDSLKELEEYIAGLTLR